MVQLHWPRRSHYRGDAVDVVGPATVDVPEEAVDHLRSRGWIDPPDDADGSDSDESEDAAESAPEAPFAPGEQTVDELRDALAANDYSAGELAALHDAETAGKARETALAAIADAREA